MSSRTNEPAYYMGTNTNSFRPFVPAKILEVVTYYPSGDIKFVPRVCFHVRYADGTTDYCPVSDAENYKLLTQEEVMFSYTARSNG